MAAPIAPEPPHPASLCSKPLCSTLVSSQQDHRQLSRTRRKAIGSREIMPIYWRRLIEMGVPINEAKVIAWAIVRYDVGKILPDLQQQQILKQYCRFICRAALWRAELLAT
jgi:hypothetical protein